MPQQYTPHDIALCNSDEMYLKLTETDKEGGTKLTPIEFQFPPRFPSDNRRGTWSEGELRGVEPIAVFSTSGPRIITMNWTYIVDGNSWTVWRIQKNISTLRGYWSRIKNKGGDRKNLVVHLKMWDFGGIDDMTARITSVDVKRSDTLVSYYKDDALNSPLGRRFFTQEERTPNSAAGARLALHDNYSLRTDVSVDLRLWTRSNAVDEKANDVVDLPGLVHDLPVDWY